MTNSSVDSTRKALAVAVLNTVARVANRVLQRGSSRQGRTDAVSRILVLELWNIGDVILAMPFLAQLRRLFPGATITLLSGPMAADLLAGTQLVDEFVTADVSWTSGDGIGAARKAMGLWRVSRALRSHRFDIAFSSRRHLREHILLALSGAGRRVGFALGQGAALTDPIADAGGMHRVEEWMQLLQPFNGGLHVDPPKLCVEKSEQHWAAGFLTSRGMAKDELLVGIHPGASLAEKRWPLERFREVAVSMADQQGIRVLAFAEPNGYGSELFSIPGVISAEVELRELIALIARCDLLVCNDSGPMHIAGALGVPTVAMFGSGIDQWFAPVGQGHQILTPKDGAGEAGTPAVLRGIRVPTGIKTSEVMDAVRRAVHRLGRRGSQPGL